MMNCKKLVKLLCPAVAVEMVTVIKILAGEKVANEFRFAKLFMKQIGNQNDKDLKKEKVRKQR